MFRLDHSFPTSWSYTHDSKVGHVDICKTLIIFLIDNISVKFAHDVYLAERVNNSGSVAEDPDE